MATGTSKKSENSSTRCYGGRSFNCIHGGHDKGKPIYCRRCKLEIGCSVCVQVPQEPICLVCHDWATDEAEQEHGKMVKNPKIIQDRIGEIAEGFTR